MRLFYILLFCPFLSVAQVGIGTNEPEADLDIEGSLLIQGNTKVLSIPTIDPTEEGYKYLMRLPETTPGGEIRHLEVENLSVAPVNVINYTFTNLNLDNLINVNLQYNSNEYIVAIANFQYDGYPIQKVNLGGNTRSIGNFVTQTFISNNTNTWHLEIRNRYLSLSSGQPLTYRITLIVYDRSFFRQLPTVTTNMGGQNSGSASSAPNF